MNIFENLPEGPVPAEITEVLDESEHLRIERIISTGQCSPDGFWYDQQEDEWVTIMQGSAVLEWEHGKRQRLNTGDFLILPAHQKHRVAWTSSQPSCIWLCVFSA